VAYNDSSLIRVTGMSVDMKPYGGVFGRYLMERSKRLVENPLGMLT
jgi:hypothetical protein